MQLPELMALRNVLDDADAVSALEKIVDTEKKNWLDRLKGEALSGNPSPNRMVTYAASAAVYETLLATLRRYAQVQG